MPTLLIVGTCGTIATQVGDATAAQETLITTLYRRLIRLAGPGRARAADWELQGPDAPRYRGHTAI
jgi:hypothetical protein